ncbi:MAG: hypothetical protein ACO3EG_02555 [Chitinophagaceae bacterium]
MKKFIIPILFTVAFSTSCGNKNESNKSVDITSEKKQASDTTPQLEVKLEEKKNQENTVVEKARTENRASASGNRKSNRENSYSAEGSYTSDDSYSAINSNDLPGVYVCSNEDMIRLNSNGTGKMIMSYNFDGIRSFTWEYDSQDERLSISSIPPDEMKYEMLPIYLTLNLKMVNGRVAFEHYTAGPTFLYIKR